jgi:formylglycine-generating enzyme
VTGPVTPIITMEYVTVGDPENAVDPANGGLFGSVDHAFEMGKYLVTNEQYCAFLNAADPAGANPNGVYLSNMGSDADNGGITFTAGGAAGAKYSVKAGMGSKPVVYVDYYSSGRFANWLGNGGMKGSNTDTGVYTITGTTAISNTRTGNTGAGTRVFLPTENEWYKAAYYQGSGNTYTIYPWGNTAPDGNGQVGGQQVANYWGYTGGPSKVTDVTAYPSGKSHYQTFDQAGNAWEWIETIYSGSNRVLRGGGWGTNATSLPSSLRYNFDPTARGSNFGFRVGR